MALQSLSGHFGCLDEAQGAVLQRFKLAEALFHEIIRAGNGIRTHDITLGKRAFYR
jgi:hypothetical protein